MRNTTHRSARIALLSLVTSVGPATGLAHAAAPQIELDRASTLYSAGRLVEARRVLTHIDRASLADEQRERFISLTTAVDRQLRRADPIAVSLEKAELLLREGNLREADRQSEAVRRASGATSEQRARAIELLEASATRKRELAPTIESVIAQAVADFDAERYPEAKAGFDSVYNSGAELSPAQLTTIDQHQDRLTELERLHGAPFTRAATSMAVFQPDAQPPETQPQTPPAQPEQPDVFQQALRFEAERHLAAADTAFDEGRYPTALENYLLVTGQYRAQFNDEELRRATARVAEIRALMQDQGGALQDVVNRAQLVRDRTIAEFENLLGEARKRLATGDTERARELAGEARLRLSEARNVFSEEEYEQRLGQQRSLLQDVITREDQIRQDEAAARSITLEEQARQQETAREAEKQQKIRENLARIRALQLERKYQEALQVVDQVLFLDPLNPSALMMKDTLRDLIVFSDWANIQREKSVGMARESNRAQEALIPPAEILTYPPDWPEISFRRGEPIAFREAPEDRRVLADLRSKRVPATFTDARLEDVLSFFAQVTNLNVDVDWGSLANIGLSRDDVISMNLQPLPAETVLDRILRKVSPDAFSRANWAIEDGVLVVASEDALRRNTSIVIYDIRDLLFQVRDFKDIPDLGLGEITQGQGGSSTSDFEYEEQEGPAEDDILQRVIQIIQSNVDPEGWRDNGGDTGDITELNGNLIITNTARNHQAIAGLLSQLREVRSVQIAVEARFLLVNANFFEQIGFDIDVIFNASNNQFDNALIDQELFAPLNPGTGTSTLLPSDLVAPFFNRSRTGGSPGLAIQNAEDLANQTGGMIILPQIDFGPGGAGGGAANPDFPFVVSRPDNLSIVPAQQNSNGLAQDLLDGSGFAGDILASNPALQLAGTFLDGIQVDFLLEATQADRRSVTLTAPRLTFTNGAAATISVLTERAFISDLTITTGTGGIGFEPTIGRVSSGFVMALVGVVSADRRYVTLQIQAQLSEILALINFVGASQAVASGTGGSAGGGVVTGDIQQPILQTTEIRTGVTVPDQGTLLLGGQRMVNEVEIETGVPVLSKMPLINRFFSNRIQDKQESTLLILVKPSILIQNEEEEKNFPGLLDSLQNRFGSGI